MNTNSPQHQIPFLQLVAEDLIGKTGNDMSRVAVVFPGKRAGLFFTEYLISSLSRQKNQGTILRVPQYLSISELYTELSPLREADPIETVCRIFYIYKELTHNTDTLDSFYGWAEQILKDFDDTDRAMADAKLLFDNQRDIKKLESFDHITEEQNQVLKQFFKDFSIEEKSRIREKFLELWDHMGELYDRINQELAEKHYAYPGALERKVVEDLKAGRLHLPERFDTYAIVGFNALDKVDEEIFKILKKEKKTFFYWDYDIFYTDQEYPREAGLFLKDNMKEFPNALAPERFDNLRHEKRIEFLGAPTENAQARSVTNWIEENLTPNPRHTAIVMCDENMLLPILHVLPQKVKEANITTNITKGYPLIHTQAYNIVAERMKECHKDEDIKHFLSRLTDEVKQAAIAVHQSNKEEEPTEATGNTSGEKSAEPGRTADEILEAEACFIAYTTLNRFSRLVEESGLDVEMTTLQKLILQVLRTSSVPFHGEPATGLQIMGMLETRCLDFEHVLILSAGEGTLPKRESESSFILPILRKAFGLHTAAHKNAIFAYYFFRLIQRAKHIRMVYNASAGNKTTGEMSRYMTQLLLEWPHSIQHFQLSGKTNISPLRQREVRKPDNLGNSVTRISPSAINTYLRCPLMFYYNYVLYINPPTPPASIIAPNDFGTVFHKAAELLHENLANRNKRWITRAGLTALTDQHLKNFVEEAIETEGMEMSDIVITTVTKYLRNLVNVEKEQEEFRLIDSERKVEYTLPLPEGSAIPSILLHGNIDRIDLYKDKEKGDTVLRILDYKTGGKPEINAEEDNLFVPGKNHPHYTLQTFIYSLLAEKQAQTDNPEEYREKFPLSDRIKPELFFVNKAASNEYRPCVTFNKKEEVTDFAKQVPGFEKNLADVVAEIFNPDQPFKPTETEEYCRTCAFFDLCTSPEKQ